MTVTPQRVPGDPEPRPVVRPLKQPTRHRSHVPPLGVHVTPDGGIDVAVLASHATAMDLCLIDVDDAGGFRERRVELEGPVYGVWHAHVPDVAPGQRYGFRAYGPWDPKAGLRYNPAKLLVDPYARGLVGEVVYAPEVLGSPADPDDDALRADPYGPPDDRDSIAHVPHGVVVGPLARPQPLTRPRVPWADTVIYEAHVRGLTLLNEKVPEELRGTYAGVAHPATIEHLTSLGVTTLELLPIHASATEARLATQGLTNYWGYNTLGFFAPNSAYATRAARERGAEAVLDEVRGMVHLLHTAGIEVLLDVVHNHTCEGGDDGLHLSWRGLDNPVYYLHDGASPAALADVTGTGNSLDYRRPRVIQLALDSLRYWAETVGVDGFRFDLAVTLARGSFGFDPDHPFLVALQTDPVLSGLKLVAEPWDVGPGGWQTGQFPPPLAEWNDRFRDAVRGFWLEAPKQGSHGGPMRGVRELATRLAGSADLFGPGDPPLVRGPVASVNYVTAHDGFTLADLVAYEHKRNHANGEDNRDGSDNNLSWNHGLEGHTPQGDDATTEHWEAIVPLRRRSQRNLLAMLLLGAGTPMITAGDESGRSQGGNNNAYVQDNEVSWVPWKLDAAGEDLLATCRFLARLRHEHPALRADSFFLGTPRPHEPDPDLLWFAEGGEPMDVAAWDTPGRRVLQMLRSGPGDDDADVLLVINGGLSDVVATLPAVPGPAGGTGDPAPAKRWDRVWDSAWDRPEPPDEEERHCDATTTLDALSVQVFLTRPAG
ncbi:glycogen debranching protein GlgX [Myceligenerans pegani]|uniref:Glycogen debranching protein GlgX n=1 Tax=Myceligenerans pegani TaxID=2776917 RepID=A0ABR9MX87_9MICO|nr:glycogen debranching protein GlgX [Myceligenerans sp. TRM 65318]MBE1876004.1 glycogen debranching protein GlgX [Myceligenerans sp. TRM 65318]MBE3018275.1 glycogen debranching protein GlgX [Myceligenerans sp. TRM 65318]